MIPILIFQTEDTRNVNFVRVYKNDVVLFRFRQSCLLYILNVDECWFVDEGRGIYEVPIFYRVKL